MKKDLLPTYCQELLYQTMPENRIHHENCKSKEGRKIHNAEKQTVISLHQYSCEIITILSADSEMPSFYLSYAKRDNQIYLSDDKGEIVLCS